jgi:hypothetical protein
MAFPHFHSSLNYALVRDFAYPPFHPMHYGPSAEKSGVSTPSASESQQQRRGSDPTTGKGKGDVSKQAQWSPYRERGDGPPYREDDDLHSPVVTTSKHKARHSKRVSRPTNGGVELPPPPETESILPSRSYTETSPTQNAEQEDEDSDEDSDDIPDSSGQFDPYADESRWSKDYQFTIVSPEEEMHGRAVALFDFARENENELPLTEGQIILVSYRQGEGWLVAQDPRTQESGLVPEEYVRLLRDIEGGYHGLMNGNAAAQQDSDEAKTPTQETSNEKVEQHADHAMSTAGAQPAGPGHARTSSGVLASGEYYPPVISTFSTRREDFERRPVRRPVNPSTDSSASAGRRGSESKGKDPA